jgi:hypothetical protein
MSLGHLIVAGLPIASAAATAQVRESSSGLRVDWVSTIEQSRLWLWLASHLLPARPRPAVCSSANLLEQLACQWHE